MPSFQQLGLSPAPLMWISTLGEGGEWEGKAEPSSLFSSKGMLRLGKAHCKSECFALFYGCVFVLRVNFALAVARAQAEPGQGTRTLQKPLAVLRANARGREQSHSLAHGEGVGAAPRSGEMGSGPAHRVGAGGDGLGVPEMKQSW